MLFLVPDLIWTRIRKGAFHYIGMNLVPLVGETNLPFPKLISLLLPDAIPAKPLDDNNGAVTTSIGWGVYI